MTALDDRKDAPGGAAAVAEPLTHRQIMLVLSGLLLGMLLAALDQTIVATALPRIVGDFGATNHISWVITAYLLTSTAATPLYGKLSDLYGRRIVFQVAIVIFLVGSVLSGLSQSLDQLVIFRALQGLGAGGLITLAMAIIGDIVPPRERGRYQGYFGAVFGLSSIVGPLLGGFFTDQASWRWIFYINLPIGLVALVVTTAVLKMPVTRREASVDWTGAALLVAGVVCIILFTTQKGDATSTWSTGTLTGVILAGVLLLMAFLAWEARAKEPILPPRLFRNDVFSIANAISIVVGFVMFGAITFLPLYLQRVRGESATASGLLLLPIMVGLLVASIGSGRVISRIGRYRMFPIIGTFLLTVGLTLFTQITPHTSYLVLDVWMLFIGLGMGCTMQTMVLSVQNALPISEIGVGTSSVNFFRSLGGSLGTAVFGSLLTARLTSDLLAHGTPRPVANALSAYGPRVAHGSRPLIAQYGQSFVAGMHMIFLVAIPIAAVSFGLSWFLREIRLRTSRDVIAPGEPAEQGSGLAIGG